MAFELPSLPYPEDALEPHIDARTMSIHHDKHHAAYTNNLNSALEGHADLAGKSIEALLGDLNAIPEAIRTVVRNNGGGYANHNLFWETMGPDAGGAPTGDLAAAIDDAFGSFTAFKEQFAKAATTRFGSGWAWLYVGRDGKLAIGSTPHQQHAPPRSRRLGARLLPQLPEPPARLHHRLVERRQLERRGRAIRRGSKVTLTRAGRTVRPGGVPF